MNGQAMIKFVGNIVTEEVANAHTVMDIVVMAKRERMLVGMETVLTRQLRWRLSTATDVSDVQR